MIKTFLLGVLILLTLIGTANAEIHKCITATKKTIYTEEKCPAGSHESGLELIDNSTDSRETRRIIARDSAGNNVVINNATQQGNEVVYMNPQDISNRIRSLEVAMNRSDASAERRNASVAEIQALQRSNIRKLSFDDDRRRDGFQGDLNSLQQSVRTRALNGMWEIIGKY